MIKVILTDCLNWSETIFTLHFESGPFWGVELGGGVVKEINSGEQKYFGFSDLYLMCVQHFSQQSKKLLFGWSVCDSRPHKGYDFWVTRCQRTSCKTTDLFLQSLYKRDCISQRNLWEMQRFILGTSQFCKQVTSNTCKIWMNFNSSSPTKLHFKMF